MTVVIFLLVILVIASIYLKDSITYNKLIQFAQANIETDNMSEAMRLMNKIPSYKMEMPFSRWISAQIYFKNGQYLMAMTKLQDIMEKKKYDLGLKEIDVRNLLTEVYKKTNRHKELFELLEGTLKMDPDGMYVNREMGKYYFYQGEYSKARYFLMRAVNAGADDFHSLFFLSKVEYERGSYVDSLYYIEKAIDVKSDSSGALLLYAILKYDSKNYFVADKTFSKLLEDEECKNIAMLYKSICLYRLDQIENSIEMAENVLSSDIDKDIPVYTTFLKTYVDALIKNKQILSIEPILDDILIKYPDDVFARNYRNIYSNVFKNPDSLLNFIILGRIEIKDRIYSFLETLGFDITDFSFTENEEYFFHANQKEFSNNSILFVFSRGDNYITPKDVNEYINLAKTKRAAMLYVSTPYYFMEECSDTKDNKVIIKLHDGLSFAKVLRNEIEL